MNYHGSSFLLDTITKLKKDTQALTLSGKSAMQYLVHKSYHCTYFRIWTLGYTINSDNNLCIVHAFLEKAPVA